MNPPTGKTSKTNALMSQRASGYSVALGALAFAMIALPSAASAQNACGTPTDGTVTCAPDGNPYPDGIQYVAPGEDLTIVLQDGVVVNPADDFNPAILGLTIGDNALTIDGATNTSLTSGANSGFVVLAATNDGDLTIHLDQITGNGASGILASSATGNVIVTANDISTTGTGSNGIDANTNSGNVTVDVGTVTTAGDGARGISATTDFADVGVTFDTVNTTGGASGFGSAGAVGVFVNAGGNGTASVTGNSVETLGDQGTGIDARSGNGPLSVNVASVTTSGDGADAVSAQATGNVATVNVDNVTTAGDNARGLVVSGATGANVQFQSVSTQGDNSTGVSVPAGGFFTGRANSATANISGGTVSTAGENAVGILAAATDSVDVTFASITTTGNGSSGVVVPVGTGGFFGSPGTTAATITGGSISTTGDNALGVDAQVTTGDVSATVSDITTTGADATAMLITSVGGNATATINGAVNTFDLGTDAVVINGGQNASLTIGQGGSIDSGGNGVVITSVDATTIVNRGTLSERDNGFAIVANGGAVSLTNSGTLTSDIQLSDNDDTLTNSGNFIVTTGSNFGGGNDVFLNSGTVSLRTADATLHSLEQFTNSGLVDLRNGQAGDMLTLPGNYTGANGTLGLDILLNGTTNVADQLVVRGLATGATTVALNQLAGSQPVFDPGTILVRASTGSAANAFDLAGGSQDQGFVRYEIQYDNTDGTYALTGAPSDTALRTLNYAEGVRSIWLKSADVVSAQLRARRDTLWAQGETGTSGRVWMQVHGSVESRENEGNYSALGQSRVANTGYEQDYFGGQLGFDLVGGSGERGGFAAGVTAGYLSSSLNFAGSADKVRFDVVNGGLYGSYSAGNFFVNALGKYDYYWADARAGNLGFQQDLKGGIYGARGEAGFRFGGDSFFVEPAASISYLKSDIDNLTPAGMNVSFDEDEGLRGRAGGRIGTQFDIGPSKMAIYGGANYVHEFQGEDTVTFASGGQTVSFTNARLRDYGEATLGLTIAQSQAISGFIEGTYIRSFNKDAGNLGIEGAGGRAGLRIKF